MRLNPQVFLRTGNTYVLGHVVHTIRIFRTEKSGMDGCCSCSLLFNNGIKKSEKKVINAIVAYTCASRCASFIYVPISPPHNKVAFVR